MTGRFDASSAECLVFTGKEGVLSAAAHDLKLRVERFELRLGGDGVEGEFDAASLRVVCARRGDAELPGALSAKDRAAIEATVASEVLQSNLHPSIRFRSISVTPGEDGWRVEGALVLRGREGRVLVRVRRQGDRARAECLVSQLDFGIEPYRAAFGTLRVKPDVLVRLELPWSDTAAG